MGGGGPYSLGVGSVFGLDSEFAGIDDVADHLEGGVALCVGGAQGARRFGDPVEAVEGGDVTGPEASLDQPRWLFPGAIPSHPLSRKAFNDQLAR
ncbi:hypothetical protein ABZX88_29290 [Kitasatospora aureofaciens]|uniref:hypothetical protein n=1 Tax=Kitasatospora aureofaciens TaxID=1894 RepID=UPI0033AEEB62